MEIWHGFVFVRFQPGPQPAVAEILARFEQDVVPHDMENLVAVEGGLGSMESAPVNWKSVRDVDNEGYHVPMAHPGLQDLYGKDYTDEAMQGGPHVRSVSLVMSRRGSGLCGITRKCCRSCLSHGPVCRASGLISGCSRIQSSPAIPIQ